MNALFALALLTQTTGDIVVLDAETREPLDGARVHGVPESLAPVWGDFWSAASTRTDAEGLATLPLRSEVEYGWCIVEADGYGTLGTMELPYAGEPRTFELHRAQPAHVRVVDYLGRPMPFVLLGLTVGCGHTPNVESPITDRDGRAVFHRIAPEHDIADVFAVGEHVHGGYMDVEWRHAMNGGTTVVARPGKTVRGQLWTHDGEPAVGWAVGIRDTHRGPWARTDDTGRFALHGIDAVHCNALEARRPDGESFAWFEGSRYGVERVLRLPKSKGDRTRAESNATLTIQIEVGGLDAVEALEVDGLGIPVEIWDPLTGWSTAWQVDPGEAYDVELLGGTYELEVGGKGSPYPSRFLHDVSVAPDRARVEKVTVPRPRIVRLEALGVEADASSGELHHLEVATEFKREPVGIRRAETGDGTGVLGVVEAFALPYGPHSFLLDVRGARCFYEFLEVEDAGQAVRLRRTKSSR